MLLEVAALNVICYFYIRRVWLSLQIIAAAADVEQKKEIYVSYNVLPLDAAGASQAIMQLDEVISSSVYAFLLGIHMVET